jgi:hypothetical protein
MTVALYKHYDINNNLLYVGVSLYALIRLRQHKDQSHWFGLISKITIEYYATRLLAEEAEKAAIKKERPLYNKVHNATKQELKIYFRCVQAIAYSDYDQYKQLWQLEEEDKQFSILATACKFHVSEYFIKKLIKEKLLEFCSINRRIVILGKQINAFVYHIRKLHEEHEEYTRVFNKRQQRIKKCQDLRQATHQSSINRNSKLSQKRCNNVNITG